MTAEDNSQINSVKVLHLNWRGAHNPGCGHLNDSLDLIYNLKKFNIVQEYLYTGDSDNTGKIYLKKHLNQNKGLDAYALLNTSCDIKPPREDLTSDRIEHCVLKAVEAFCPDIIHIHHLNGFVASIIERLKISFNVKIIIALRDYWYICPLNHLINYKGKTCKDTAFGDQCVHCFNSQTKIHFNGTSHACWAGEFETRKLTLANAINHADQIHCVSQSLKACYVNRGGIISEKIKVIKTDATAPEIRNGTYSKNGKKPKIGFSGDSRKGLDPQNFPTRYAQDIAKLYVDVIKQSKTHNIKKIELGGGETPKKKLSGFVNVDFRATAEVDVVADVKRLPFGQNAIEEIYAANLVEHFNRKEIQRVLLEWWRSINQGGWMDIVVPDLEGTLDNWRQMPFHRVLDALYGAQKFIGDNHYNGLTPETLKKLLIYSGFNSFPILMRYTLMDVPRIFVRAQKKTKIRIYPFGDIAKGSARLRIHNIYPFLAGMGYDVHLYGDPRDCDVAIFQKIFDPKFADRCKGVMILDIDDNFFEFTARSAACKQMAKKMSAVVASTATMKSIANKYCDKKIKIIPTSIDQYRPGFNQQKRHSEKVELVGWVGNPENLHYLDNLMEIFKSQNIKLRIITKVDGVNTRWLLNNQDNIELYEWTLEGADKLLEECDVCVAPLKGDAWSMPKSAVKILKYWALGLPVVCSPNPEYLRVEAELGVQCVAHNKQDWIRLLNCSRSEKAQQVRHAQLGIGKYSAASIAKLWSELIDELVYAHNLKNGASASFENVVEM